MSDPKILLYYAFAPIADPEAVRLWQRELCESLGLRPHHHLTGGAFMVNALSQCGAARFCDAVIDGERVFPNLRTQLSAL